MFKNHSGINTVLAWFTSVNLKNHIFRSRKAQKLNFKSLAWVTRKKEKTVKSTNRFHLLQLFELLPASCNVLLPSLQALQAVDLVASPRGVDVPHSSERGLHAAGHLSEERLEGGHALLVDDDSPGLVVRVAVAEHEDVLDDGLSQEVGLLRTHRRACGAPGDVRRAERESDTERARREAPDPGPELAGRHPDIRAANPFQTWRRSHAGLLPPHSGQRNPPNRDFVFCCVVFFLLSYRAPQLSTQSLTPCQAKERGLIWVSHLETRKGSRGGHFSPGCRPAHPGSSSVGTSLWKQDAATRSTWGQRSCRRTLATVLVHERGNVPTCWVWFVVVFFFSSPRSTWKREVPPWRRRACADTGATTPRGE